MKSNVGQNNQPLKFIDLFAGLGGCYLALKELGCECVFASEIKDDLRKRLEDLNLLYTTPRM